MPESNRVSTSYDLYGINENTRTSLHRIEFLFTGPEMESLRSISCLNPRSRRSMPPSYYEGKTSSTSHTFVSIANSGSQLAGGTILAMPYFRASARIFCMYCIGSRNSSSVGRNVGASCSPWGLVLVASLRTIFGCDLLLTPERSRASSRLTLRGMWGA